MIEKRKDKKKTKKEMKIQIDKAFNSLDKIIDSLIDSTKEQGFELLTDTFELSKKISGVYRKAHLAVLKGGNKNE